MRVIDRDMAKTELIVMTVVEYLGDPTAHCMTPD